MNDGLGLFRQRSVTRGIDRKLGFLDDGTDNRCNLRGVGPNLGAGSRAGGADTGDEGFDAVD